MTLNDFERKNRGFIDFGDFGLQNTFQERIAPKINWDKHEVTAYEIFSL